MLVARPNLFQCAPFCPILYFDAIGFYLKLSCDWCIWIVGPSGGATKNIVFLPARLARTYLLWRPAKQPVQWLAVWR